MLSVAAVARRRRLEQLAAHPHTPATTRRRIQRALDANRVTAA